MGVDSFAEDILRPLRRLARENHLAVVLGAGASVAAGLPTWSKLVQGLLARPDLPPAASQDLAELLLRTQGYLLGAEAAFDANLSAAERKRRIARALFQGQSRDDFKPTSLHFAVVALAQARGLGHIELFTTNYDDLLEHAFELFRQPCRSRYEFRDTADALAFTVHHLHGLLGRRRRGNRYLESADLVLTQADYDRIYRAENDWPGEALAQAAARGPLLFLGSSLTDPNLVRYLNRIKDRRLEPHVLVLSRQGLGVSQDLYPPFRLRLAEQWRKSNVDVVLLEDYSDVTTFVLELACCSRRHYRAPGRRIQGLWQGIGRNFGEIQTHFAASLDRQFRRFLEPLLGREALIELWLADGRGDLVRFAANDRIYRSPRILRRIPYRWDAGWTVTEAVSSDLAVLRPIGQAAGAAERRLPDERWRYELAVPVRVPGRDGYPALIAGALSASTAALEEESKKPWAERMEQLSAAWSVRLEELLSRG